MKFILLVVLAIFGFALGYPTEFNNDEDFASAEEEEPAAIPEPKLSLLEGIVRKDFLKLHKIQARRTGSHKGPVGPVHCTFQGKIAMRDSCDQFFICRRAGTTPTISICPANKRFHHQLRSCLKMSKDDCLASMCQTTTDKFRDPYAKENYLSCRNMFPQVFSCPEGQIFNDDQNTCVKGNSLAGFRESYEVDQNSEKEEDFHSGTTKKPFKAIEVEKNESPKDVHNKNGNDD